MTPVILWHAQDNFLLKETIKANPNPNPNPALVELNPPVCLRLWIGSKATGQRKEHHVQKKSKFKSTLNPRKYIHSSNTLLD